MLPHTMFPLMVIREEVQTVFIHRCGRSDSQGGEKLKRGLSRLFSYRSVRRRIAELTLVTNSITKDSR